MSSFVRFPTLDPLPTVFATLSSPPHEIYYQGDTRWLDVSPKIAIVGTRKPSPYTKEMVTLLSESVTKRGGVVVSGMAMGVDAIAHKAANDRTIAILGNGIDQPYPMVNKDLYEKIKTQGLLLSQYPPKTPPLPYHFIERNRLVVALSDLVIIAQADRESGSLHSASFATKLGKPLFVLPQRLGESLGTHDLLLEKRANAIEDIDHFISHFLPLHMEANSPFAHDILTLEDAVKQYGDTLYEWELQGKITIEHAKVYFHE